MNLNGYVALLNQYQKEYVVYKARIIIITISQFISPLIAMIVLMSSANATDTEINSAEIFQYYLYTSILYIFMHSKIDTFIGDAIVRGGLATFLIRPIHFPLVTLTYDLATRLIKLLAGLPIFFILLLFSNNFLNNNFLENGPLIIITLIISFCLTFSISFIVGNLAFFIEEIFGIQNLKDVSILLLGGVIVPYAIFPEYLSKILIYTPFPYLINWPIRAGFTGNLLFEFSIALTWLLILSLIGYVLWRMGLKKYSAIGTY